MPPKIWTRGLLNPPPESAIDVSHADTHGRMSRYVGLQHPWESENEELNSDHEITPQSDHEITTTTTTAESEERKSDDKTTLKSHHEITTTTTESKHLKNDDETTPNNDQ